MVMHHSYAYGSRGRPKIPPYSNLVFDVHLKSISRPDVGTEDLETKQRTSHRVSSDNPVHVQDQGISGQCNLVGRRFLSRSSASPIPTLSIIFSDAFNKDRPSFSSLTKSDATLGPKSVGLSWTKLCFRIKFILF